MKKFLFLSGLFIFLAISCGSNQEKKVSEFAVKFGDFVNLNEKDSISKYYPGFQPAESLENVSLSNITVTPGEAEGIYNVVYSPKAMMTVSVDKNGEILVKETKGLLVFPSEQIDFAKKTGMWNDNLSDQELMQRLNDKGFYNYISNKAYFDPDKILTVGKEMVRTGEEYDGEVVTGYYTITNNTNQTINASDYKMNFRDENSYCDEEDNHIDKYSEKGIEIAPFSTIKVESSFRSHQCVFEESHHLVGITFLPSPEEIQDRFVKFTGNEYQEYLDLPKGEIPVYYETGTITGTVDKYPITMNLTVDESNGKVTGWYYYNKMGSNKKIQLSGIIEGESYKGASLTLTERVNGKVSGTFSGLFRYSVSGDTKYNGSWISSSGKAMEFEVKSN